MSAVEAKCGSCSICGIELEKASAAKHLSKCLSTTSGNTEYAIVKVVGTGWVTDVDYWLFAAAPIDALLEDLDEFLRKTWLECCGHMSAFREKREEVSKSSKIGQLAASGAKLVYEYDFGSTTELKVTFLKNAIAGKLPGHSKIKLLVRNNMPEIACDVCGKMATQICTDCIGDNSGFLCDSCVEGHPCETVFLLPVTNSPRCGVCAYEG
jgi:hypothetical protein